MIETENLRKEFKGFVALDGISFSIEEGEIFGLVGKNGSGKTTLLRILATLLKPDGGKAKVAGYDVVKDAKKVKPLIGYVPEAIGGFAYLKVWEYLDFFGAAYRIKKRQRRGFIADVLALTEMTSRREALLSELSRGERQRVRLAKTFLHEPLVFLLDEPASGLDRKGVIELREFLKELSAMGKTICIASNNLSFIAETCAKVGILQGGKLLISGDIESILAQINPQRFLEIKVRDCVDKAKEALLGQQSIANVTLRENTLIAEYTGKADEMYQVLNALVGAGIKVLAFWESAKTFDSAVLKVIRDA